MTHAHHARTPVWDDVCGDKSPLSWVLLAYADANTLEVRAKGTGGLDEIRPLLKSSECMYGGVRVDGVDVRGGVTSRRPKMVFFSWVGPTVKMMAKARARG